MDLTKLSYTDLIALSWAVRKELLGRPETLVVLIIVVTISVIGAFCCRYKDNIIKYLSKGGSK